LQDGREREESLLYGSLLYGEKTAARRGAAVLIPGSMKKTVYLRRRRAARPARASRESVAVAGSGTRLAVIVKPLMVGVAPFAPSNATDRPDRV